MPRWPRRRRFGDLFDGFRVRQFFFFYLSTFFFILPRLPRLLHLLSYHGLVRAPKRVLRTAILHCNRTRFVSAEVSNVGVCTFALKTDGSSPLHCGPLILRFDNSIDLTGDRTKLVRFAEPTVRSHS